MFKAPFKASIHAYFLQNQTGATGTYEKVIQYVKQTEKLVYQFLPFVHLVREACKKCMLHKDPKKRLPVFLVSFG